MHAKAYPLRFIFICDIQSVFQIEKTFQDILPPFDLTNFIGGKKLQRFKWEFVDIEPIIENVNQWSKTMQKYFNQPGSKMMKNGQSFDFSDRYNDTIYYISPYYPKIFPKLDKLIVMGK